MSGIRAALIWGAVACAIAIPVAIAATSPLLEWREPVYIVAGFAGVVAMGLLLIQPLLIGAYLPGVRGRYVHRWTGAALVLAVAVHVGALWLTSPPDVVDALLLASPTPFSLWGVIAMWAVFAAAVLALWRARMRLRLWRAGHTALVVTAVAGSVAHALLIEGTMGTLSKLALCVAVVIATLAVVRKRRAWRVRR